jgi:hypothetical protein
MRQLPDDSPEWPAIMEKVFELPMTMCPFLQAALKARRWIQAFDPVAAVRRQALRLSNRQPLRSKTLVNPVCNDVAPPSVPWRELAFGAIHPVQQALGFLPHDAGSVLERGT